MQASRALRWKPGGQPRPNGASLEPSPAFNPQPGLLGGFAGLCVCVRVCGAFNLVPRVLISNAAVWGPIADQGRAKRLLQNERRLSLQWMLISQRG